MLYFCQKNHQMNIKIAIAGFPKSGKTLLAQALSCMTEIPYIRTMMMYEWKKIFNISDTAKINWKDAFLIASAAFYDRAKSNPVMHSSFRMALHSAN